MIKKLIEKNNAKKHEKYINKPRYTIKDLYLGEICILNKREHHGDIVFGTTSSYGYLKKKFAICYGGSKYGEDFLHIKSNQIIKAPLYAEYGDYAIFNLRTFKASFPLGLRKLNLTENDKLSIKEITDLEDVLNEKYAPDLEVDELIK